MARLLGIVTERSVGERLTSNASFTLKCALGFLNVQNEISYLKTRRESVVCDTVLKEIEGYGSCTNTLGPYRPAVWVEKDMEAN